MNTRKILQGKLVKKNIDFLFFISLFVYCIDIFIIDIFMFDDFSALDFSVLNGAILAIWYGSCGRK